MNTSPIPADEFDTLATLCKTCHVQRLEFFGPSVTRNFHPRCSALDFPVTLEPCSPGEHYERNFGFPEFVDALLSHRVDLVETGALRNPYFLRHVNATKMIDAA